VVGGMKTRQDLDQAEQIERAANLEQLIDIAQLAELLGVTVRHIRRLVAERRIQYVKVGKFVRFDPADVRSYVLSSKVAPVTSPLHDSYARSERK
jgi:excisionase family DNA binding protein